jgi:hypothetical protein
MDGFGRELMGRSRLASAVLDICDFIFDDKLLISIWEAHCGRCYEDAILFGSPVACSRVVGAEWKLTQS